MLSSVGVVLPLIGVEFQADGVSLSLVESVFLGVNAMCLLCFGRASDLMGRNWIFTLGLGIFTLATVSLGLAQDIITLIAIRAIQAFGGAMQVSTGLAILLEAFLPEERGKVLGIAMAFVYMGVSAGPFLGGLIAGFLGWRGLFLVGSLPCLLALALALKALKWDYFRPEAAFDYYGAVISMLGIGLLLFGGANADTIHGVLALAGFLGCTFLFLRIESRSPNPLLDLAMFRKNSKFSLGNLLQFINYATTFGLTFLMSLYLQLGRGMTPAEAGTILLIQPLTQSVLSPICGRLADRHDSELLVAAGMLFCVAGVGWASTFDAFTSLFSVSGMLVLLGIGVALFASPNMKTIMQSVSKRQYGVATAVTGQMRTVGMTASMVAISMAISFIVGDRVLDAETFGPFNQAMTMVLRGSCLVGVLGMVLSLLGPGRSLAS
jgi:MFS family permease